MQDSGARVDGKDLDRMFPALYTTKGRGIECGGRTIARTIVEAHGGRLSAANNANGEATLHFTLPMAPEHA